MADLTKLESKLGEVEWALPIQKRHLKNVLDGSLDLAGQENPDEVEG